MTNKICHFNFLLLLIQEHTTELKDAVQNITVYLLFCLLNCFFVDYLQCCATDDESSEFREGKHHVQCHSSCSQGSHTLHLIFLNK